MASIIESSALAVVDILLTAPAIDVVAVLDENFQQLFSSARPMRGAVRENSEIMKHPIETGQIISDYKVILPIEIDILFMVPAADYRNTYQQIKGQFITSQLLTVQTKASSYRNMVIAEMPHEEKPEIFDSLLINLHFTQIQVVETTVTFAPKDPVQTDTKQRGEQAPAPISSASTPAVSAAIKQSTYSAGNGQGPSGGGGF